VFFVPYVLFQPPATVLIRKIGPPIFLSTLVLVWGILMIVSRRSLVTYDNNCLRALALSNHGKICLLCAFFWVSSLLDTFQPAYTFFHAGIHAVSTKLHRPKSVLTILVEVQKRFSIFYCIGVVIASLSGILSFGLAQMNGVAGLGGWSWIFILEGIVS
jgi:hypothetical protein